MFKSKDLKKVSSFFNKIITNKQKQTSIVEVDSNNDYLYFTLILNNDISISYKISNNNVIFDKIFVNYEELSKLFSSLKKYDVINIIKEKNSLNVQINDVSNYLNSVPYSTFNLKEDKTFFICELNEFLLLKALEENKVLSSNNSENYKNNLFFSLSKNQLSLYSTNDIAICFNQIQTAKSKKDFSFSIENKHISILYKWLNTIVNAIKIFSSNNYIYFISDNSLIKISISSLYNLDDIIDCFYLFNQTQFNKKYTFNLLDVLDYISNELKCLDKNNQCLTLNTTFNTNKDNMNDFIYLDKSILKNIIDKVSEFSSISILNNDFNSILIHFSDNKVNHKFLINTIKQ